METEKQIQLTREELYQRVWQTPMATLCKEFGISDKGLAKICAKNQIPKPGPGYWRKLERGFKVEKTILPLSKSASPIVIRRRDNATPDPTYSLTKIVVPERVGTFHSRIREFREHKKKSLEPNYLVSSKPRLHFHCCPSQLPRTLRILDTIFKNLEQQGCSINISGKGLPIARLSDEDIEFQLDEIASSPGHLILRIESYEYGVRRSWRDGKRQRIENILHEFIHQVEMLAAQRKKRTEERERDHIEWEKREERRRIYEEREALLLTEMERCERVQQIMKYVDAIRNGSLQYQGETDTWITWVEAYMEALSKGRIKVRSTHHRAW